MAGAIVQIDVSGAYVISAGQDVSSNDDQLAFLLEGSSQITILGSLSVFSQLIGEAAVAVDGNWLEDSMIIGSGGSVDVVATSPANAATGFDASFDCSFGNAGTLSVSGGTPSAPQARRFSWSEPGPIGPPAGSP